MTEDTYTHVSTATPSNLSVANIWGKKKKIFLNKAKLKVSYMPETLNDALHRSEYIRRLQNKLLDVSQCLAPNNIIIYGKPGTGKTCITTLVTNDLEAVAELNGVPLTILYINCEDAKSGNGIVGQLTNELLYRTTGNIKETIGNSKSRNNINFNNYFNNLDGVLIIILDEIDKIKDVDFVNKLVRTKSKKTGQPPCLIMITNKVQFKDYLAAHTKSVLAENQIQFDPYNAEELADILKARVKMALYPNVVDEMVIPLCAAFAAQEHGDARKAIDLLYKAAEMVEDDNRERIEEADIRLANEVLDIDRVGEIVKTLPTQSKAVLYSIIALRERGSDGKMVRTGEIYNVYCQVCRHIDVDILTQRRITDLISELDILGLVNAVVVSKGKYGRTKEIAIIIPLESTKKILLEDYRLKTLVDFKASVFRNFFKESF